MGAEVVKLEVIYEDNHIIVVKKPPNVLTQGDSTGDRDMLSIVKDYIKEKYNKPGAVYLGLVHRLDRPVGGVMVFARTSKAASRLSEQVRNRSFKKGYMAVLRGCPDEKTARLEDYLLKDKKTNTVSVVKPSKEGAKKAVLEYDVMQHKNGLSLVKIKLETGRPHQIRVQFSSRGTPLFGDQRYGRNVNKKGEQIALWSYYISITHPTLKKEMEFYLNPPKDVFPWSEFKI